MSNEDEIRVGDRFELEEPLFPDPAFDWSVGDIATVVSVVGKGAFRVARNGVKAGGMYSLLPRSWRRLPREQPAAPTIEERRTALKPGDVIRDPALLCKGMTVKWADAHPSDWYILGERSEFGAGWKIRGCVPPKFVETDVEKYGVTYLGMAGEEKPETRRRCDVRLSGVPCAFWDGHMGACQEDTLSSEYAARYPADGLVHHIDTPCGHHGRNTSAMRDWAKVDCPGCLKLRPSAPACLASCSPLTPCRTSTSCPAIREDAIAARMASRTAPEAPPRPAVRRSYEAAASGMGGMLGPILSQRAR